MKLETLESKSLKELRILYPNIKSTSKKVFLDKVYDSIEATQLDFESDKSEIQPTLITETIGLGDVVESITKATGVKKVVEKLTKDCGCNDRKKLLNRIPIFRKARVQRCLEENQIEQYKIFIEERKDSNWTRPQQQLLIDLYAHAFALQYNIKNFTNNCQGCAGTLQSMQDKLDALYNER